jgi:enoyl-CoA hydratase/carnithine racemase
MPDLLAERTGNVLVLTLNRPDKRNALSFDMFSLLEQELEKAETDDRVAAIVVTGSGQKAFCSGIDVGLLFEHLSSNPKGDKIRKVQRELQSLFNRLEEIEKPTIAAVEGHCAGGGFELALACDLRVASTEAKFSFPEVKIGMLPDLGGTTRIARLVGPALAKEWVMTGRQYPAVRALELGLINELVVPGDALLRARHLAEEIAANGPMAVAWSKRVIDRGLTMSMKDALDLEQDAMTEILPGPELKEGVLAFLEKRPPKFRG